MTSVVKGLHNQHALNLTAIVGKYRDAEERRASGPAGAFEYTQVSPKVASALNVSRSLNVHCYGTAGWQPCTS